MAKLFGTDGIRGVANRDLTPDLILAIGRAAGVVAAEGGVAVVGRDTRLSGPMLEAALVAGLCSAGVEVRLAGIIPTPAVAFLTTVEKADTGAVISASHNPVPDNGIKFFSAEGYKIDATTEEAIEAALATAPADLPQGDRIGTSLELGDAADHYIDHLLGSIDQPLQGVRVVLDCAFGAAYEVGPRAFKEAGADVTVLNAEPDGARINVNCGSTDLSHLAREVLAHGADMGFAFDGDADRVLAIDEEGGEVDGDRILALSALRMKESGKLRNNLLVATVMANLGFRRALADHGIDVVSAAVGDKHVVAGMIDHDAALGGEQSGHVIFSDHSTTGDGILTALQVASAVAGSDSTLARLAHVFEPFPQVLINVPVASRDALEGAEGLWERVRAAEAALGDDGRVLLRASGTEQVVRVMVEAADADVARRTAAELADEVRRAIA
ncbi:MAG TPA: phosphoglucosamine mutase [Actinomycetota bacterium]|nr:phosphoglucosamine mutase [Actinomycetota bacterium]